MTSQDTGAGRGRESSHSRTSREWVGGSLSAPFFIHDRAEPYRPCIVIWFELPDGLVVGQTVVMPEDARGAVASALRSALTQPEVGLPRQPHSMRVPDAATAAEVRTEVAGEIPVTVAPTPELDALFDPRLHAEPGPPFVRTDHRGRQGRLRAKLHAARRPRDSRPNPTIVRPR